MGCEKVTKWKSMESEVLGDPWKSFVATKL